MQVNVQVKHVTPTFEGARVPSGIVLFFCYSHQTHFYMIYMKKK